MPSLDKQSLAMSQYEKDPLGFIENVLGVSRETFVWSMAQEYGEHKWDGTVDPFIVAMDALVNWQNVGIESATGVGKTFWAACIILWFLAAYEDSLVVTGAPKADQLKLHVWQEISKLWPKFSRAFPEAEFTTLRIRMRKSSDTWSAQGFVAGVSAEEHGRSAVKAQGFHRAHMLIVCEETPGINPAIMEALQNTSVADHNLILAMGNPDHMMDQLHQFCTQPGTVAVRISGYDHPNVVLANSNFIPGATTKRKLDERLEKYGEDNPLYMSRCKGLCPMQSEHSLIRYEWLLEAKEKWLDPVQRAELSIGPRARGIDVANSEGGDKGAVAEGTGGVLESIRDFTCPDANALGTSQSVELKSLKDTELAIKDCHVGVDSVGVGAGCYNEMKRLGHNVASLQGGMVKRIDQEEQFVSLRAQMWWQLRQDLQHGRIALPPDDDLFADLVTPLWKPDGGKIYVEPKERIKGRLGRSPNKGDAVVYWNWVRQSYGDMPSIMVENKAITPRPSQSVRPGVDWGRRRSAGSGRWNL